MQSDLLKGCFHDNRRKLSSCDRCANDLCGECAITELSGGTHYAQVGGTRTIRHQDWSGRKTSPDSTETIVTGAIKEEYYSTLCPSCYLERISSSDYRVPVGVIMENSMTSGPRGGLNTIDPNKRPISLNPSVIKAYNNFIARKNKAVALLQQHRENLTQTPLQSKVPPVDNQPALAKEFIAQINVTWNYRNAIKIGAIQKLKFYNFEADCRFTEFIEKIDQRGRTEHNPRSIEYKEKAHVRIEPLQPILISPKADFEIHETYNRSMWETDVWSEPYLDVRGWVLEVTKKLPFKAPSPDSRQPEQASSSEYSAIPLVSTTVPPTATYPRQEAQFTPSVNAAPSETATDSAIRTTEQPPSSTQEATLKTPINPRRIAKFCPYCGEAFGEKASRIMFCPGCGGKIQ